MAVGARDASTKTFKRSPDLDRLAAAIERLAAAVEVSNMRQPAPTVMPGSGGITVSAALWAATFQTGTPDARSGQPSE